MLNYFISFYDECKPFSSIKERSAYTPKSLDVIKIKYTHVNVPETFSMGGIVIIIKLFYVCKKQTAEVHQFKLQLQMTRNYMDGKINYRNLLNLVINHRKY